MAGITHTKVSIIADDPNYDIMPSDWNAEHTIAATVPNVATTAANDFIVGNGSVWQKKTLAETQDLILAGGWVPRTDTWTYASATTITVPSGAAAIYSVGDKIKLTANSVVLYAYIVTVADTLLTVKGNALTNHTFTLCYYSKAASPVGFPSGFDYTPTGIAGSNVTIVGRFSVQERRCFVEIVVAFTGAITFTTMPTLPITANANYKFTSTLYSPSGVGGYYDAGTGQVNLSIYPAVVASATTVSIRRAADGADLGATVPITWANGDALSISFSYEI